MCTKFGEFTLTFDEMGVHFMINLIFTVQILSVAVRFWTFTEK